VKKAEDRWCHLQEEIAEAEQRLSDAQLSLLPSSQAADELELFLNDVSDTLRKDEALRPKSVDEFRELTAKYKVFVLFVMYFDSKCLWICENN
jgi:hypothetical protein